MTTDAAAPVLVATGVTKQFGGLVAVNDVDFVIPKGSIVSLIGPNGAGKTTFFNVVAGLYEPTEGVVTFGGREMIATSRRAWAEPLTWVLPTVVVGLVGFLVAQVIGSDLVLAVTLLAAVGLLIAMFLLAIIRPPVYERMLHRLGIFKSARPNDMVVAGLGRTFQNIRLFKTMTAARERQGGNAFPAPRDAAGRRPATARGTVARRRKRIDRHAAGWPSWASRASRARRPATWRTATSAGWKSPAPWPASRHCSCWTSRPPA